MPILRAAAWNLRYLQRRAGIVDIADDRQSIQIRERLAQDFKSLCQRVQWTERRCRSRCRPVAPMTSHHPAAERVHRDRKHNRNRRSYLLCGGHGASHRNDDIHIEPNEFGGDIGVTVRYVLLPSDIRSQLSAPRSSRVGAVAAERRHPLRPTLSDVLAPRKPIVGRFPGCCACAASGHAPPYRRAG